jgi:hypothetical protein
MLQTATAVCSGVAIVLTCLYFRNRFPASCIEVEAVKVDFGAECTVRNVAAG